jgi:hypothetical protein
MKNANLVDWIEDPHQKIYYESDYNSDWTFFIELIKILPDASRVITYPACVKVNGDAPKQRGIVIPYKDETDPEEGIVPVFLDDYEEDGDDEDVKDGAEEVIDADEADAISDEGSMEEGSPEEEV